MKKSGKGQFESLSLRVKRCDTLKNLNISE